MKLAGIVLLAGATLSAATLTGDAKAGAALFESQKCITCHSISGKGGTAAPDLAKQTSRGYTPVDMAALMWNHAPEMFAAIEKAGIARPKLTPEQAADLFAFFYAARYFEQPGDAARGRKTFVSKNCSSCHNINSNSPEGAKPVMSWVTANDPIELVRQMWNHAPQMREAMKSKKITPPQLTAAEMNDIIVYLRNLPQAKNIPPEFAPASAETGATLFVAKGCADCHKGANALDKKATMRTIADFAASMWNHSEKMVQQQPALRPEEMTRLVGYVWSLQFSNTGGDKGRGQKVFTEKGCIGCHPQGAPPLPPQDPFTMVSALWTHGNKIQTALGEKKIPWPRMQGTQMADLLAYFATKN